LYGVYPNPIHVSSDGYVIDGNARVEAARKLGLKELPAIIHGIECSKEGDKCLSLRVLLHLESDRMGYNEVGEMASIINKYAQEYLETLDEGSRKKLLDQLRRYESTRRLEVEEPLRSFLNYMMKRTGFPSSTIMRLLDIP
jgi:hypothetical protein